MRVFYLVAVRELKGFYRTSGAYVLYFMFLLITSLWIFRIDNFLVRNIADFRIYFSLFPYVLSVVIPALTMGSWAGERSRGTYDLILSQPLSSLSATVGKYAAVMIETMIMIILTLPVPLTLGILGDFDGGQIAAQYTGIILFSSTVTGLGLFVSSLCGKQMQAYIITLMLLVVLVFTSAAARSALGNNFINNIAGYISPAVHLEGFNKGIIDSRDMFFYVISTVLFVYLSSESIKMEKWS